LPFRKLLKGLLLAGGRVETETKKIGPEKIKKNTKLIRRVHCSDGPAAAGGGFRGAFVFEISFSEHDD